MRLSTQILCFTPAKTPNHYADGFNIFCGDVLSKVRLPVSLESRAQRLSGVVTVKRKVNISKSAGDTRAQVSYTRDE